MILFNARTPGGVTRKSSIGFWGFFRQIKEQSKCNGQDSIVTGLNNDYSYFAH